MAFHSPSGNVHNIQLTNRYLGYFKEGVRAGQGIFFYTDGSKYEGEWSNNLKHGYGMFTGADGDIHEGEYANDRLLNPPSKL